ncbi:MAG: HAMP domain-containing protein [Candidatus Riflebacteria bacterium]|nr:HAMP domain-containing protein [Candidatus Riflebacteria bacterium]
MADSESMNRSRLNPRFLVLTLILSVLPFLLLLMDVNDARRLQTEDVKRRRLAEIRQIGARFPKITTPVFWAEEMARRLRARVEKTMRDVPITPERLAAAFDTSWDGAHPAGITGGRLWAMFFPDNQLDITVPLLVGKRLESTTGWLFSHLLNGLIRDYLHLTSELDVSDFVSRYRNIFGAGTSRKLLSRDQCGTAFNVIYQGEFGIAVWNVIMGRNRPIGIFLMIIPTGDQAYQTARNAAILNWHTLFPGVRVRPGFIPFRVSPADVGAPPVLHSDVAKFPSARRIARCLQSEMRIAVRRGSPATGFPLMPTYRLLEPVSDGPWWGLPCQMAPLSGGIGLLLTPAPHIVPMFSEHLAKIYGFLLAVFWPCFLAWIATGRPLPTPGVRMTLLLWFAGLAATPVALIIGSGDRLQLDLASNLRDRLDRVISSTLQKIDTGSVRIDMKFAQICRSMVRLPRLGERIQRSREHPDEGNKILNDLWRMCPPEMSVQGIMIFGHGSYALTRFSPDMNSDVASTSEWYSQGIAGDFLRRVDPVLAKEYDKKQTRVSSATKLGQIGLLDKNKGLLGHPNTVDIWSTGTTKLLRYFNLIRRGGNSEYAIMVIWNQDKAYVPYLQKALLRAVHERGGIALAAFRINSERRELVFRAGNSNHLALMARRLAAWGLPSEADGMRMSLVATQKISGFQLAAVAPLGPLNARISAERAHSIFSLVLLAILIAGGAALLSQRLALPIMSMTEALVCISADNLDVSIDEGRGDELGDAARKLDAMTARLRERRMMSRFVAPQVRDVVAQGDLDKACVGTERHVALLVSDVRSFTAMSESYPPKAIFDLLNEHLKIMTTVIQKHGGAVDRFIGDAIQAVFYPGSGESMVIRALSAAREMMEAHTGFSEKRRSMGLFEYRIGVGVELGTVVTGVIGDPEVRLDFTVLGEPMKHCAELEGASKFGRATRIICSPEVRESAGASFSFIPAVDPDHQNAWEISSDESCGDELHENGSASVLEDVNIHERMNIAAKELNGNNSGKNDLNAGEECLIPARESNSIRGASSSIGFIRIFFLLIFWMLPVFLICFVFHSLEVGEIERGLRDIRAKLEEDRKKAEAGQEPQNQISLDLFHRLNRFSSKIQSLPADVLAAPLDMQASVISGSRLSPSSPIATDAVRSDVLVARGSLRDAACAEMQRISRRFASPSWYLFEQCSEREWLASQPSVESSVMVASGGIPVDSRFTDEFAKCLFARLKTFMLKTNDKLACDYYESSIEPDTGLRSIEDGFIDAMGQLAQISPFGKSQCLIWIPIMDPLFRTEFERESAKTGSKIFDERLMMRRYLIGGIVLFIDPALLTPDNGWRSLIANLAATGCVAAVQPLTPGSRAIVNRKFRLDHELHARFLEQHSRDSMHHWETIETIALGRPSVRMILARRSDNQDNPFPRVKAVLEILAGAWFCAGLCAAFFLGLLGRPFAFSLRGQLGGAFLFVMVPALALGMIAVERSLCEKSERIEIDQRRLLMETVSAAEESSHMYLSCFCSILDHLIMNPKFISVIGRIEAMKERDADRACRNIMSLFMKACLHNGVFLNRPMISGIGNLCLIFEGFKPPPSAIFIEKGFSTFIALALESLKGSSANISVTAEKKGAGEKLLMGFVLEEFSKLFLSFTAPDSVMDLMLAPKALNYVKNLVDQSFFYRRFLPGPDGPRYGFVSTLSMEGLNYLILNRWTMPRQSGAMVMPVIGFGYKESPAITLTRPYRSFRGREENDYRFEDHDMPQAPDIAESVFWASFADAPIFLNRKSGRQRELMLCAPSKAMSDAILTAEVPIGLKMEGQAADAAYRRKILAWLLLAAAVLALQVAGEFLKPVKELSKKAGMITAGRFDARLPEWRGGEFGVLARAFNAMAIGISEGRLLSRFVSESVRDAAVDMKREEAANRGEQRDVTVLFAGLADFKSLLVNTPPDALIRLLNRYLQVMSRAIRANGGEIDKFIGDKILAVFHDDALGGRDKAAAAAVEAAIRMRRDHEHLQRQLQGILPNHLGVGIVTGTVLAGIMGTPDVRLEYTVIGDTVNLASRLGDLALRIDESGMVRPDTDDCVGGIVVESLAAAGFAKTHETLARDYLRKLELPPIKGKTRSVEAFVVLS